MRLYQNFLGRLSSHLNLNKTPASACLFVYSSLWLSLVNRLPVSTVSTPQHPANSKHQVRCTNALNRAIKNKLANPLEDCFEIANRGPSSWLSYSQNNLKPVMDPNSGGMTHVNLLECRLQLSRLVDGAPLP
jgi:hypothetical protein